MRSGNTRGYNEERRRIIKKRKKEALKKAKGRLRIIVLIIMLGLIVLVGRLVNIYAKNGKEYSTQVMSQQSRSSTVIPFKRGDILDRNGNILATSVKVYNLILDPKLILSEKKENDGTKVVPYLEPTVDALVECFGYDKTALTQMIMDNAQKNYFVKDKRLTSEQISKIKEILADEENNPNVKGITFEEEYKRTYPKGSLACSTIGFTVSGNVGNWGIEEKYNDYLNGTDGRSFGYVGDSNTMESIIKNPEDGSTVVSTIDMNLQSICEKWVNKWVADYNPKQVAVVMADPNNGEILAMCSSSNIFDLNDPADSNNDTNANLSRYYTQEEIAAMTEEQKLEARSAMWRNYCISDTYEAGSTIKPFTVAGALESGKISKTDTFVCDGYQEVGGFRIRCHKVAGHGTLNVEQAIMNSCNDCLMQIAAREGIETFCDYQSIFNFGMKTGVDLPGEASCDGLLYTKETMTPTDLATNSFGQNFNVNMMQMVAGFASLINGGNYYKPHVVKEIVNAEGGIVENYNKDLIRQTITTDTSDFIKQALVNTVVGGTGKTAAVAGYTVGGKTGTAQHHDKNDNNYLLSFLGYASTNNEAKVICYTIVDSPDVEDTASSAYACRLFSAIMTEGLPYLNIFPETDEAQAAKEAADAQRAAEEASAAADTQASAETQTAADTTTETQVSQTEETAQEETTVATSFSDDEVYEDGSLIYEPIE